MDEKRSREGIISILNDDDSPSFYVRRKEEAQQYKSLERPTILRQPQYAGRISSISSISSPPLLRFDSSSSSKSTASMNSSPSPSTPAYLLQDGMPMFHDLNTLSTLLPFPTGITPFMEQQSLVTPGYLSRQLPDLSQKQMPILAPQYPIIPLSHSSASSIEQSSLPSLSSENSAATPSNPQLSPPIDPATNPAPTKKNKYPCPYAASHNCDATFTTSGHAARHGKKHTGEKGVRCPTCDKAFTRKDNMKQHQRTHKVSSKAGRSGSSASATSPTQKRNKAAVTKEAQRAKDLAKRSSQNGAAPELIAPSPAMISPPPRQSLEPLAISNVTDQTPLFQPNPMNIVPDLNALNSVSMSMPTPVQPLNPMLAQTFPQTLYPSLMDNTSTLLDPTGLAQTSPLPPMSLTNLQPLSMIPMATQPPQLSQQILRPQQTMQQPPPLIRGFSDLDTLAQAAEEMNTLASPNSIPLGMGMGIPPMPMNGFIDPMAVGVGAQLPTDPMVGLGLGTQGLASNGQFYMQ